MTYQQIHYEVDEAGLLTLTLHRPDKLNAFTGIMAREIHHALSRADEDDNVRALIVTGSGRAFCAGADLESGASSFDAETWGDGPVTGDADAEQRDAGGLLTLRLFDLKKPVIGAINGPAVGIGATLQLPMDVRLASEEARFGFVFTQRGIVPEACSSWFLPRIVGISQALDWTLSGRVFSAEEALAGGLVRSVHPAGELLSAAREVALRFTEKTSAVSVALARQMMWKMLGADHPMEAHKVDSRGMLKMGTSDDCKEGVMSFLDKRPAKFTMKPSTDMPDFYPWWPSRRFE